MPAIRLFVIPMILFLFGCGQDEVEPEPLSIETEQEKKLYALGQAVARQFVLPGLFDDDEITIVGRGFADAVARRDTLVDFDSHVEPMNTMLTARRAVKNLQWGIEFRKMAATWPGAITTDTGLIFQSVEDGTGASPTVDDTDRSPLQRQIHRRSDVRLFRRQRCRQFRAQPGNARLDGGLSDDEGRRKSSIGTAPSPCPWRARQTANHPA